jgi:rRNA-processing protein EBP2
MVTKSKLKMALLAEKGVDLKKENQMRLGKKAQRERMQKSRRKHEDERENVEREDDVGNGGDEAESEDGGVALFEDEEDGEGDGATEVCR